ncbi:MAG: DUF3644 domain-containing protein [Prevotellaceae bacterium]|jgi:hypothetical protein|nr:DUF3644 domain-containing protein [Prevotellaceae bacterium]
MSITWTSLFHAIFFKQKIKSFYTVKVIKNFEKNEVNYSY